VNVFYVFPQIAPVCACLATKRAFVLLRPSLRRLHNVAIELLVPLACKVANLNIFKWNKFVYFANYCLCNFMCLYSMFRVVKVSEQNLHL